MISVYKRELKGYFLTYIGYIFIAFILLVTGIYSWFINFLNQSPRFEYIIYNLNFIYLIAIPLITMRTISEDRKQKTDILLYSLPLKSSEIAIGKYLATVSVLLAALLPVALYPLIISVFGTIAMSTCYSTLIGFFLLGATLISIGLFISALTDNPLIAAIGTFAVLFISYLSSTISTSVPTSSIASFIALCIIAVIVSVFAGLITKNLPFAMIIACITMPIITALFLFFPDLFEGLLQSMIACLSLFDRLSYFVTGVFDITSVIYYISVSALFLFLTAMVIEKRRWS